ncbi:MAG TPA: hypothetical protein PKA00_16055 [Saprospiraceae bacterium]|nr:hypothetical protein [Saprospiraceae bacterium]HMQ84429.1 hypothetical protein [Saprospiraceae bacterium]
MRRFLLLIMLLYFNAQSTELLGQTCRAKGPPFYGYSFLSPYLVNPRAAGAPFFTRFEELEEYYRKRGNETEDENITEWYERYCEIPVYEHVRQLIYETSRDDLRQLRTSMGSRSRSSRYSNTFAAYLQKHQCTETVDYLIFAKECEPLVSNPDPWEDDAQLRKEAMLKLLRRGQLAFQQTQSHYIRLRYVYQILRLAHYAGEYQMVLDLHDELMAQTDNDSSVIEYWIKGHVAGAMMGLGRRIEANYLYAQIFEYCPGKRTSAFRSFQVKSDEEWEACLNLCQNNKEKAALYAIRANNSKSRLVPEMRHIYEMDPTSDHLKLLLLEEVRKLEKNLLGLSFNDKRQQNKTWYSIPTEDIGTRINSLKTFVSQVLAEGQIREKALWWMIDGYLSLLAGNYYDARKAFSESVEKLNKNPALEEQLAVFELALKITALDTVGFEMENDLARIRAYNLLYEKYEDFSDFTDDKLANLYTRFDEPGKAFLFQHSYKNLKPNPQIAILDNLIAICLKPTPSKLEEELVAIGDSTIINDLLDIKSTLMLSDYQQEAALETLKKMDRANWDDYGLFSPFEERFIDCVRCRQVSDSARYYNKGELIERLLDMEYQARAGTGNTAWLYYQIGLAYYNMSYFGYAWRATDYFRSGASLQWAIRHEGRNTIPHPVYPFGNRENFDCSRARLYFERARLLSNSTELSARATFMAAKCEQNQYYLFGNNGSPQTHENFDLLIQNYRDTEFYNRIIQECRYLRAYVEAR